MLETKDKITIGISILALIISFFNLIKDWIKSLPDFDTAYFMTKNVGVDDEIILYNKSSKKVTISDFRLYTTFNNIHKDIYLGFEDDFVLITILPNEFFKLSISDQYKFKYGDELYLKIKLLGVEDFIDVSIIDNGMW
nr:hypothetical protein [Elizabethkingia sp. ASV34]